MSEPDQYYEIPGVMRVPKNLHLSESGRPGGGLSSLARDEDNRLTTHAEFFPEESDSSDDDTSKLEQSFSDGSSPKDAIALAVTLFVAGLAGYGLAKGVAYLKERRSRKRGAKEVDAATNAELPAPSREVVAAEEPIPLIISQELEPGGGQPVLTMSPDEWQALLREAATLTLAGERLWMILSSVRIEDANSAELEWQRKMKAMSPGERLAEIRHVLHTHPELQGQLELSELIKLFVNNQSDDGVQGPERLEA